MKAAPDRRMLSATRSSEGVTMPASPDARPRRAADRQDVHDPPASAESGRDDAEPDGPDKRDAERAEPDPPDEGWEPV